MIKQQTTTLSLLTGISFESAYTAVGTSDSKNNDSAWISNASLQAKTIIKMYLYEIEKRDLLILLHKCYAFANFQIVSRRTRREV